MGQSDSLQNQSRRSHLVEESRRMRFGHPRVVFFEFVRDCPWGADCREQDHVHAIQNVEQQRSVDWVPWLESESHTRFSKSDLLGISKM
jgi:hypothetical protein